MKTIDAARLKEAHKIAIEESIGQYPNSHEHAFAVRMIYTALAFGTPESITIMGRERIKVGPVSYRIAQDEFSVGVQVCRHKPGEEIPPHPVTANQLNKELDELPGPEEFELAIAKLG